MTKKQAGNRAAANTQDIDDNVDKIRQILELTRKREEDIRRAWREIFGMDLDAARMR